MLENWNNVFLFAGLPVRRLTGYIFFGQTGITGERANPIYSHI
jgi:hypothetical protein